VPGRSESEERAGVRERDRSGWPCGGLDEGTRKPEGTGAEPQALVITMQNARY
jgi:hypothetical protein